MAMPPTPQVTKWPPSSPEANDRIRLSRFFAFGADARKKGYVYSYFDKLGIGSSFLFYSQLRKELALSERKQTNARSNIIMYLTGNKHKISNSA